MTDAPDRKTVREGYELLAESYASKRSASDRELAILDQFLQSDDTLTRVLDAGCGQGRPILRRTSRSAAAVGVDFSRAQLRLASEAVPSTPLVQADMTALPFRDGVFDAVLAYHAIIHVPLADHEAVLDEFARVLRDGGRLLLSEAPERRRRTNPAWLGSDVEMTWAMAGVDATRRQLRRAGFDVVHEWGVPDEPEAERPEAPFLAARFTS
jgi:ubiquinone/menaquinone biosynthesis C-methylase UbiE